MSDFNKNLTVYWSNLLRTSSSTSSHLPFGQEPLLGECILPRKAQPHTVQCLTGTSDLNSQLSQISILFAASSA